MARRTLGAAAGLVASGFARRVGRMLQELAALAGALVLLGIAAALLLTWRLGQGPLDVDWLARRIEAAANGPGRPVRLTVGHATLAWSGFAGGPDQGLVLHLDRLHLDTPDGTPVASAGELALTLSMSRLLVGEVVPRSLVADRLDLGAVRRNGAVKLDLGGLVLDDEDDPTVAQVLEELARPPRRPGTRPARPDLQHIEELERVRLTASTLRYTDPALVAPVRLALASLDLRRRVRGGVTGTAAGTLSLGGTRATLALAAELTPEGGTQVKLAVAPVNATSLQAADPTLASSDSLDSAIQGSATLQLDGALHPVAATADLTGAPGRLNLAGTPIGFDALALSASATWDSSAWTLPQHLSLSRVRAVIRAPGGTWPSTVTLAAHIDRTATALAGTVQATIDHLAFADIGALWPVRLGGHIRPWLVPNVTAGTARDGAVSLAFTARPDFSEPALTAVDGTLRGEDVTIWWLRPVPPIEQAQATLSFKTPQSLDITVTSARQGLGAGTAGSGSGGIALANGLLHFTGLDEKDQFLSMGADVVAPVADLVALLRNPALKLLSRSPFPLNNPAGAATGHLAVSLPMKDVLPFELVRIQASLRATGLRLAGIVAGRDLDHGTVALDGGSDGLHATGTATVGGIPADLVLDLDFRPGGPAQVLQQVQAVASLTPRQLAGAGFDPGSLMPSGSARVTARYSQRRDGAGTIQVGADLAAAGLAALGWTKPAGQPGTLAARVLLRGDRIAGVDEVHATAAGLAVDGRLDLPDGRPPLAVLDRLALGGTEAAGQVSIPAGPRDPVRVELHGAMLDLAPLIDAPATPHAPASSEGAPGPPWVADLRFDRVRLSAKPSAPALAGITAHAENDGRHVAALTLASSGPEQLRAAIRRDGAGRRLTLDTRDGGALVQALGVAARIEGGHLRLDAVFDDAHPAGPMAGGASPLAGTAELTEFRLGDAPVLGKLLQAATIYGVVDALRGPGLVFSDMVLPFRYESGVLQLMEMRAFSASLGLTAHGRIDTVHGTVDVQGTVVPAYVLNSALGRIPLVGGLFRNERGGGLVAVDYALRGPLADPAIRVNPLSALTPGFLRGLFHLFD